MSSSGSADSQLDVTVPCEADIRILEERQLGHKISNIVGIGQRCRHGFGQAFAFDPLGRPRLAGRKSHLESGLFRLSCPLLVKAVDEWEREGAVRLLNAELEDPTNAGAAAGLEEAHAGHAAARHEIIGERLPGMLAEAEAAGPEQAAVVRTVLKSGIAGQTRSKLDVKCVHAQLADTLCRSGSNAVGASLLERLAERGVPLRGSDDCCAQCDLAVPESEARERWWYEPSKNKWKLRKRLLRRRARKEEEAAAGLLVDRVDA